MNHECPRNNVWGNKKKSGIDAETIFFIFIPVILTLLGIAG